MKEYYIIEELSEKNIIFDKELKKWKIVNDVLDYKSNNDKYCIIFNEENLVDELNEKFNGYYKFKKVYIKENK